MGMSTIATQPKSQSRADDSAAVPPGYKWTEAGLIPEDWDSTSFGEVIDLLTGYPFPSRHYSNSGVRLVRGSNVKRGSLDWSDDITEHWPAITSDIVRYELREGDLVVAMDGALVGRSYAVISKSDLPCLLVQRVARIRSRTTHSSLLTFLVGSNSFVRHVDSVKTQTAIPHISPGDIRNFSVAIPTDPDEQRAMAVTLSDVDELIGALDNLIAKKQAIKQATMQQLLTGKTRLRDFAENSAYKRTDAGTIPVDWEALPLGELFTFKNGLNKAKQYFGFGTPIVNYMDVYGRRGLYTDDLMGRVSLSLLEIKNFAVEKGDVFFTRTSETVDEIGMASVMLDDPCDTVFSGFVLRARPKDDRLDDQYKKYCFSTIAVRKQIVSKSTYTTRALTNGRLLSAVFIARPPLEEQRAIATILADIDAEITALERRCDKTKAIKQGMMQALLTGRVRLIHDGANA